MTTERRHLRRRAVSGSKDLESAMTRSPGSRSRMRKKIKYAKMGRPMVKMIIVNDVNRSRNESAMIQSSKTEDRSREIAIR